MSDTKFLYSLCYSIGLALSLIGVAALSVWFLAIGAALLALPGILFVPRHIYLHLTSDDLGRLEAVVEEYMSGFIEISDVEQEINEILKKHGYTRS